MLANFTPEPRGDYRLGVPQAGEWREVLNSDATFYGGAGLGNYGAVHSETVAAHGHAVSLVLTVPPLALLILRGPV
jgi:1,4-alpha-glucan branching enzyme